MSSPNPSHDSFASDQYDDQWDPYDYSSQQTQTNEQTNELKFCQLSDWDNKKTYDKSYTVKFEIGFSSEHSMILTFPGTLAPLWLAVTREMWAAA